jgi:hypothetical protein
MSKGYKYDISFYPPSQRQAVLKRLREISFEVFEDVPGGSTGTLVLDHNTDLKDIDVPPNVSFTEI